MFPALKESKVFRGLQGLMAYRVFRAQQAIPEQLVMMDR
jgi:hypothetical protein